MNVDEEPQTFYVVRVGFPRPLNKHEAVPLGYVPIEWLKKYGSSKPLRRQAPRPRNKPAKHTGVPEQAPPSEGQQPEGQQPG